MPAVVTIGDALVDLVDGAAHPGGAALNVACGLATLGCESLLVAQVGDDQHGQTLRTHLKERGVALLALPAPHGSSVANATVTDDGVTYAFNEAARSRAFDGSGDVTLALDAADLVVVSSFPFEDATSVDSLLSAIPDSRARLVVDPNPRTGYLGGEDDVRAFGDNLRRVAARSVLVKLSDEDAQLLYQRSADAVAEEFIASGTAIVVTTHGAEGASLARAGQHPMHVPAAPLNGDIVDTIGAGDATLATIVDGMLRNGGEWKRILERAMRVAGATIRSSGGALQLPTP